MHCWPAAGYPGTLLVRKTDQDVHSRSFAARIGLVTGCCDKEDALATCLVGEFVEGPFGSKTVNASRSLPNAP